MEIVVILIFWIAVWMLVAQGLIDRSLRHFKQIEYEVKIKELEERLEKIEKQNK